MKKRAYPSLKAWRGRRSQREAAKELGISQAHYSRLENGKQSPKRELKRILDTTGVPLETLVGIAS